jgi:VanZ family protein
MTVVLSTLLQHPKVRLLLIGCAVLMYLAIVIVGNLPGARADIGHYASGVALHSTAYAVLTALIFLGSTGSLSARAGKAVLAVAAMGAGDEFIQSFFPYRGADVRDWAVDCTSAIVTAGLLCLLWRKTAVVAKH